ncbi:hypothetical protein F4780DRAFT_3439 [Xylariomycetidae sp. FL0641]|nr:hypothetical protein F4780DRAFT_3439 [Xylariomycetidae sp. FL0641]
MADARALLRAHRAENRIKHPHAGYSDAGKLLCKLCHEAIKTEALWDGHTRSAGHKARLQQAQNQQPTSGADESTAGQPKRKHSDVAESPSDAEEEGSSELLARKKRHRTDPGMVVVTTTTTSTTTPSGSGSDSNLTTPPPQPLLSRRASGTPVQGVEIAIPSRPATPSAGGGNASGPGTSNSATSTPKDIPMRRSPFLGGADLAPAEGALAVPPPGGPPRATSTPTSAPAPPSSAAPAPTAPGGGSVDEAEWAAFEAEMAAAAEPPPAAAAAAYAEGATIAAPALSAAEVAAAKSQEEEEAARRRTRADAEIATERDEAAERLEDEFAEMAQLEGRVRRLKAKREALRHGGTATPVKAASNLGAAAAVREFVGKEGGAVGKENVADEDDDDDDEDEDEDEDGWDGFRFRA